MRGIRPALAALLLLTVATALPAQRSRRRAYDDDGRSWLERCRRDGDRDYDRTARYCEERSMGWSARAGATLNVDAGPNGGVEVEGWNRDSVDVVVRIQAQAESEDDARDIASHIRVSQDGGTLRAEGPGYRRRSSWSVSYKIRTPASTNLELATLNGPLAVGDVTGTMRLTAINGPLALGGVGGDVRAHVQNGPLSVELVGSRWEGAGLDAEAENGPLSLSVPEGYNAELETGTINGPMDIEFPVTVQGRIGMGAHRHLTTTLGSGGPRVRAVTTNGPAVIRRS